MLEVAKKKSRKLSQNVGEIKIRMFEKKSCRYLFANSEKCILKDLV